MVRSLLENEQFKMDVAKYVADMYEYEARSGHASANRTHGRTGVSDIGGTVEQNAGGVFFASHHLR